MTKTIAVTSGKGGVGKTNISANLALCLASAGSKPCLFDADFGLANINILLGLHPERTLEDVIFNGFSLEDIVIRDYMGMDIIPGSSGFEKLADLDRDKLAELVQAFSRLDGYDFLIFDTSAGISRQVVSLCLASSEVILVITPEPTSLTDGYALLKILSSNGFKGDIKVVANLCGKASTGRFAFFKLEEVVRRYLPIEMHLLGVILKDEKVTESVKEQKALVLNHPDCSASRCIRELANNLLKEGQPGDHRIPIDSFWARCFDLIKGPLRLMGTQKGLARKGEVSRASAPASSLREPLLLALEHLIESVGSVAAELTIENIYRGVKRHCGILPEGGNRNGAH